MYFHGIYARVPCKNAFSSPVSVYLPHVVKQDDYHYTIQEENEELHNAVLPEELANLIQNFYHQYKIKMHILCQDNQIYFRFQETKEDDKELPLEVTTNVPHDNPELREWYSKPIDGITKLFNITTARFLPSKKRLFLYYKKIGAIVDFLNKVSETVS